MMHRNTVNGLQPRTERELMRDAYDWWEAPPPQNRPRLDRWAGVAVAFIVGALCALWLIAWAEQQGGGFPQ